MRRGAKARLRRLATEVRAEVGLTVNNKFDPYELATKYGVHVQPMSDLDCDDALEYFGSRGFRSFSGAQVLAGQYGSFIIDNDLHSTNRRRSTVSHEMAHVICEHPHEQRLVNERGCRAEQSDEEDEATFLSGELLLPTETARLMAFRGTPFSQVAIDFAISIEMARWRMNISGGYQMRANSV